jgi:hypothetical protein
VRPVYSADERRSNRILWRSAEELAVRHANASTERFDTGASSPESSVQRGLGSSASQSAKVIAASYGAFGQTTTDFQVSLPFGLVRRSARKESRGRLKGDTQLYRMPLLSSLRLQFCVSSQQHLGSIGVSTLASQVRRQHQTVGLWLGSTFADHSELFSLCSRLHRKCIKQRFLVELVVALDEPLCNQSGQDSATRAQFN